MGNREGRNGVGVGGRAALQNLFDMLVWIKEGIRTTFCRKIFIYLDLQEIIRGLGGDTHTQE